MSRQRAIIPRSILLPLLLAGAFVGLWIDSAFETRVLPFLPGGDAAIGFRSADGWLQWVEFTEWDEFCPFTPWISVPYLIPIAVSLGLALRNHFRRKVADAGGTMQERRQP